MYLLAVVGLIACKDADLFEAFSRSWPRSATFYTPREMARRHYGAADRTCGNSGKSIQT